MLACNVHSLPALSSQIQYVKLRITFESDYFFELLQSAIHQQWLP